MDQVPLVEMLLQASPQLTCEASLVMIKEGGVFEIWLNDVEMLFTAISVDCLPVEEGS